MHNPAAADVHAMMVVSTARSGQMGAEWRLPLEFRVMRCPMRVVHRCFPSICRRVRVDRSAGRSLLWDSQAVSDRANETSGDQYGSEECEHAKRIHRRFLEFRSM
jgi:hypothetical protein